MRITAYAMVRRRPIKLGVAEKIGKHSIRVTGITTYLENDGALESAQETANYASPRTTKLYDRRGDRSPTTRSSGSVSNRPAQPVDLPDLISAEGLPRSNVLAS